MFVAWLSLECSAVMQTKISGKTPTRRQFKTQLLLVDSLGVHLQTPCSAWLLLQVTVLPAIAAAVAAAVCRHV